MPSQRVRNRMPRRRRTRRRGAKVGLQTARDRDGERDRPFRPVGAQSSRPDSGPMPSAAAGCVCIICLDSHAPRFESGCACRSKSGLAHVGRLIEKAVAQQSHRGNQVRRQCQTCGQDFKGGDATGAWKRRGGRGRATRRRRAERGVSLAERASVDADEYGPSGDLALAPRAVD